jgi:hypothetical protein
LGWREAGANFAVVAEVVGAEEARRAGPIDLEVVERIEAAVKDSRVPDFGGIVNIEIARREVGCRLR